MIETHDSGAFPAGQRNLILADPPWPYAFSPEDANAIENQYPTMGLDAIKALPVAELAADDSVLFLWTTAPKLADGLSVLAAWGFRYVTSWIWQKTGGAPGMGYWARIDHEILLIGTRGAPGAPDKDAMQFSSVITAAKGRHSEKPAIFHERIEQAVPHLTRRLELFARDGGPGPGRAGWARWGHPVAREEATPHGDPAKASD
jgi:N6-adenosine-specific RNA methylase IME4